ncbi:MAG: DUF4276 family protein [Bryobacteraceae bacterium]
MIRLHAVVEGQTEESFVNRILAQELWPHQVITDVHMITTGRHGSRIHRGGLASYAKWRKDLTLWMKEDHNPDARFTTMVDLFRLPSDFPGYDACRGDIDPLRKAKRLEDAFADDIEDRRFIPYIQVHEFEALLFVEPLKFDVAFPGRAEAAERLAAVRRDFSSPEHIDDGAETAPSKRILAVLPEYQKPVAGPLILQHIGMTALRRECAHFDEWIRQLESCGAEQTG